MRSRIHPTLLTALMAFTCVAEAQSSDVTFQVPLNLTKLHPDITKVRVGCSITSPGIFGPGTPGMMGANRDVNVSGGQIVTTVTVVVAASIPADGVGKSAAYACALQGLFILPGGHLTGDHFAAAHANPALRLSPTPPVLTGNFTW